MASGFDAANTSLTSVVIAHVDSVTIENIVVNSHEFAVTRLAAPERKLDQAVS
jgi:hypothetical protein